MTALARKLVSKSKRRFISADDGGFDLDLSYITPQIIAMGFPSENIEGVYRNPMSEVVRFLETKHKDHYRVYNLCSERSYDVQKFHGRVGLYPFDDHNAPPIEKIKPFCDDVSNWLNADPQNVAVVHCKAGKGRTGVMICCYILHAKMYTDAEAALQFYGAYRTENQKGVTIPSQVRYVGYYAELVNKNLSYQPRTVFLKKITLHTIPKFNSNQTCCPFFIIKKGDTKLYASRALENVTKEQKTIEISLPSIQPLCGDIKIEFHHKEKIKKPTKMFHFWFNTFFVFKNELVFKKKEIDKANKDKKHAIYESNFEVLLEFVTMDDSSEEVPAQPSRLSYHEEFLTEGLTEEEEDLSDDESVMEDDGTENLINGSVEYA